MAGTKDIPNRAPDIVASMVFFIVFSSVFVFWRLYMSTFVRRKWRFSDHLILGAQVFNFVSGTCSVISSRHAAGRHIYDITPEVASNGLHFIWIAQLTNLLSSFFTKASIASYLVALSFSRGYVLLIWLTVGLILALNLVFPLVAMLGTCSPIARNWNRELPGTCWPPVVNAAAGYGQAAANCVTDAIYTAAPLMFLSQVKLNSRTQWALRAVFLVGLLATACSVIKITILNELENTVDFTWDGVPLSIVALAEVSVGIFAACLPPLRLAFESLVRRIRGDVSGSDRSAPYAHELQRSLQRSQLKAPANDFGSERSILVAEDSIKKGGITKTVNVHVQGEERARPSLPLPRITSDSSRLFG